MEMGCCRGDELPGHRYGGKKHQHGNGRQTPPAKTADASKDHWPDLRWPSELSLNLMEFFVASSIFCHLPKLPA